MQTSAKGYKIYLQDERGRRFPLNPDPSVAPIDVTLNPRQSVNTLLTFIVASDTKRLYLMGDPEKPAPSWLRFWGRLYSGGDSKPVLLQILSCYGERRLARPCAGSTAGRYRRTAQFVAAAPSKPIRMINSWPLRVQPSADERK